MRGEAWKASADCHGRWEVFDATTARASAEAERICRTCPVRRPCADYARETKAIGGVWGGMHRPERGG